MKKTNYFFGFLILVILAAGAYFWKQSSSEPEPVVIKKIPVASLESASPSARYPVPSDSASVSKRLLPVLNESDLSFEEELIALWGKETFESLFQQKELIRRIVTSTENARERIMPPDFLPMLPVKDSFKVVKKGEKIFIDPKNELRYSPYIHLLDAVEMKKITSIYFLFYPLFQAAYREINAKGYFNDRFIQVVDQLLNTPEPKSPVEVVALDKSYKYANEHLESLSAIQKTLIRTGSENEQKIKSKLHELRNLIILGQ